MGTFAPSSLVDDLFFASSQDTHILTQALTHELSSYSKDSPSSSSSSSFMNLQQGVQSHGFLQRQQVKFSQVGSSNSVSMDKPESNISSSSFSTNSSKIHPYSDSFLDNTANEAITHVASLLSSQSPSVALSSQASVGTGATKVSKRRSRASKKTPIKVLSADASNFRAMVQQLTGIPTSHGSQMWGVSGESLLKPQPTRLPYSGGPLTLPTLDTSASLLKLLPPMKEFPFLQRTPYASMLGSTFSQERGKPCLANQTANTMNADAFLSSSDTLPSLWESMENGEMDNNLNVEGNLSQFSSKDMVESCLTLDDFHVRSSYNTVDSWLTFDGGATANHSPKFGITTIASN